MALDFNQRSFTKTADQATIDEWVNSIKSDARDKPIIAENIQKVICAAETLILFILALK